MKQEVKRKEEENGVNDKVRFFIYGFKINNLVGESFILCYCVHLGVIEGDFNG